MEVPALSALPTTVSVQIWNTMLCGHQGLATVTCLTDSSGHMHTSWGVQGSRTRLAEEGDIANSAIAM